MPPPTTTMRNGRPPFAADSAEPLPVSGLVALTASRMRVRLARPVQGTLHGPLREVVDHHVGERLDEQR